MFNHVDLSDENVYKLIDLLNMSIYWKDYKGRYLGCNKYVLDHIFNMSSIDEIIGKTDSDLIPLNEANKIYTNDQLVIKQGSYTGEERVTINGKEIVFFTIKVRLSGHQDNPIIFGTSLDITSQKEAEEQKLRQIIDLVDASIYWKDTEGYFQGCNQYVLDMFAAKSREEIIGKNEYDLLTPEQALNISKIDKSVLKKGSYRGKEIFNVAGGIEKIYFTVKNQLLDNKGEVIGIVGTSLDITAQQEAEVLKLEVETHKIQAEANRKLIATKEKFEKFIEGFANDLQSPLTSLQSVVKAKSAVSGDELITAKEAVIAITDISSKILGKYDKNIIPEAKQLLILSATISDAIYAKKIEIENSEIEFDFDFGKDTLFTFINIQPSRFHRMMSNLIENAIEALENNPGTITLSITLMGDLVSIAIKDTGKGMSKEQRQRIMNNVSVNGNNKKYSLGYAQIRKTLQDNNGNLAIYSKLDYGSTAIVGFPVATRPNWIVEKIKIAKDYIIIILDEDESIYNLWDAKLKDFIEKDSSIKIYHFTEVDKFIEFINNIAKEQKENILLLTEYKFANHKLNGLEIIDNLEIRRCILVTNYYSNLEIREESIKRMVKILPKSLISYIMVKFIKKPLPKSRNIDFVWVNDDKRFIDINIAKYYTTLQIDVYYEPASFLENFLQYPLETTIILNDYYATGIEDSVYKITGFNIAEELHKKGYEKIYLLSSTKMLKDDIPNYLSIIQKDDNEMLQKLNKL